MSFAADKKREHESEAEKALEGKDYGKAFFHTAKAAEFGLMLAEQSEGPICERYVDDAFALLDIAEQLKSKAPRAAPPGARRALTESGSAAGQAPSAWRLKEQPDSRLDDVAGLGEVKEVLREKVLYPFQRPEVYQRFRVQAGAGVLMYGPPGNGKTFIARAIAGEVSAAFFPVDASQIRDKYVGETEKNLKSLFDEASTHERAVIFLDEVDHLLSRRGNQKIGAVTQFLALTDGLIKRKNCLLILAATNKPWMLDPAVLRPGRIGTHVYVGLPDEPARQAIIEYTLRGVPTTADVVISDLAAKSGGFSGADVAALCDRAKMSAIRRQLATGQDEKLTGADFAAAIERIRPSVTKEQLEEFDRWRASRERPSGADDED